MVNPSEPPPSYEAAVKTHSSTSGHGSNQASSSSQPHSQPHGQSGHLQVPGQGDDDAIPAAIRRSMEDEARPLPKGWVRSYDPETGHQFFVDTTKEPPRSIWMHPYDDDEYLRTLSSEERERIEEDSLRHPHDAQPSKADIMHDHTDVSDNEDIPNELPPRKNAAPAQKKSFGRKMKDKYSGSRSYPGGYGGMFAPPGMYSRPGMAYGRPYGRGYGGGYGMPMALGGGLLGGMMLGGALGGGF